MQKQKLRDKLLEKLDELVIEFNKEKCLHPSNEQMQKKFDIEEIVQDLLEKYLKEHPQETDLWFKLALTFFLQEDIQSSIEFMENILAYDPTNAHAFILLVFFHDYWPFINDEVFERLEAFKVEDNKLKQNWSKLSKDTLTCILDPIK